MSSTSSHAVSLAFLNIVCPGLAQVLMGKTAVGVPCLVLTNLSFIACLIFGATRNHWSKFTQFGWFCVFLVAVLAILSAIDAVMSIKYKNTHGELKQWQLFPLS